MTKPDQKKNGTTSTDLQSTPSSSQSPGQGGPTPRDKGREFQAVVATSTKKGTEPNVLRRPPSFLHVTGLEESFSPLTALLCVTIPLRSAALIWSKKVWRLIQMASSPSSATQTTSTQQLIIRNWVKGGLNPSMHYSNWRRISGNDSILKKNGERIVPLPRLLKMTQHRFGRTWKSFWKKLDSIRFRIITSVPSGPHLQGIIPTWVAVSLIPTVSLIRNKSRHIRKTIDYATKKMLRIVVWWYFSSIRKTSLCFPACTALKALLRRQWRTATFQKLETEQGI